MSGYQISRTEATQPDVEPNHHPIHSTPNALTNPFKREAPNDEVLYFGDGLKMGYPKFDGLPMCVFVFHQDFRVWCKPVVGQTRGSAVLPGPIAEQRGGRPKLRSGFLWPFSVALYEHYTVCKLLKVSSVPGLKRCQSWLLFKSILGHAHVPLICFALGSFGRGLRFVFNQMGWKAKRIGQDYGRPETT